MRLAKKKISYWCGFVVATCFILTQSSVTTAEVEEASDYRITLFLASPTVTTKSGTDVVVSIRRVDAKGSARIYRGIGISLYSTIGGERSPIPVLGAHNLPMPADIAQPHVKEALQQINNLPFIRLEIVGKYPKSYEQPVSLNLEAPGPVEVNDRSDVYMKQFLSPSLFISGEYHVRAVLWRGEAILATSNEWVLRVAEKTEQSKGDATVDRNPEVQQLPQTGASSINSAPKPQQ